MTLRIKKVIQGFRVVIARKGQEIARDDTEK